MTKGFWSELEDEVCPCKGTGWALMNEDWENCFIHYHGQIHPESKMLLLDDKQKLQEEDRRSQLRWKISKSREKITVLQAQIKIEQRLLAGLELELINKTPTIKMPAVKVSPSHIEIEVAEDEAEFSFETLDELPPPL